jgi:multiple sugar transport system ATP-binding protein
VFTKDGGMTLQSPSVNLLAPPEWAQQIGASRAGSRVVLGVRPEHVHVVPTRVEGAVPAEVFVVEDLGSEMLVDTRVDGQPVVARVGEGQEPAIGDTVWLTFDHADAHVFDPATEHHLVART